MSLGEISREDWRELCRRVEVFLDYYGTVSVMQVAQTYSDREWVEVEERGRREMEDQNAAEICSRYGNSGVYFILDDVTQYHKIGQSGNILQRFRSFVYSFGLKPVLHGVIAVESPSERRDLERRLHERFDQWRVRGEWFDLSDDCRRWMFDLIRKAGPREEDIYAQ